MLLRSAGRALVETSAVGGSAINALRQNPRRGLITEDVRKGRPFIDKIMAFTRGKEERTDARTAQRRAEAPDSHEKMKLLSPYELSRRIIAQCDKGHIPEAITLVKEAPLDAQSPAVWGTLIRAVMDAGKYKEAYRLFTDMKRRGFSPTTRTFNTLLAGYADIRDWEKYSAQLNNVYSLYDQLQRHYEEIKRRDPHSRSLSVIPYTYFIVIFGKAQQFQRMFDVFNSMPLEGPLAPSIHTYTAVLNGISIRKAYAIAPSVSIAQADYETQPNEPSYNELMFKNATDAKLIWRQLIQASAKSRELQIDSHALRALLRILSRGRPSDQNFAFDIVYEYFGLAKPGQYPIPPKVELLPATLQSILVSCNNAKRYNLTIHYINQIIESDSGMRPGEHHLGMRRILATEHMNTVLEAYASRASFGSSHESEEALETLEWMLRMQVIPPAPGKAGGIGPQITPTVETYELVALTCSRSADWPRTCKAFQLMTGYDAADFRGNMDKNNPPKQEQRSQGRNLVPTASIMRWLVNAALKTHDGLCMQQVLNILEHYGADTFVKDWSTDTPPREQKALRRWKIQKYHAERLAQTLADSLPILIKLNIFDDDTKERWKALQLRCKATVPSYLQPAHSGPHRYDPSRHHDY